MKNLGKHMKERGLKPVDFYKPLNIYPSTFYRKKKGELEFSYSEIVKILEILNEKRSFPILKFEDL